MSDILTIENRSSLAEILVEVFESRDNLTSWLQVNYKQALQWLTGGNLLNEISNIFIEVAAKGRMAEVEFLQKLADDPPLHDSKLPTVIYALTAKVIKPKVQNHHCRMANDPHRSLFVTERPFVDRDELRIHLAELGNSPPGPRRILVINGKDMSGKSYAIPLALACQPQQYLPTIDIDDWTQSPGLVNACDLACTIAEDTNGCPSFDSTKEEAAVPFLVNWLQKKLSGKDIWIIVDHCNRRCLTEGARSLLKQLAVKISRGDFSAVRLILVDFDPSQLPPPFNRQVRYDPATLPDRDHVKTWCQEIARFTKRKTTEHQVVQWVSEIFSGLDGYYRHDDGTWHQEFERRLQTAAEKIMACKVLP